MVNSLHHQGMDRLAPASGRGRVAPDGQIEAVSMPDAPGFLLGVQWHPEWRWAEDPLSRAIFGGFGACDASLSRRVAAMSVPEISRFSARRMWQKWYCHYKNDVIRAGSNFLETCGIFA